MSARHRAVAMVMLVLPSLAHTQQPAAVRGVGRDSVAVRFVDAELSSVVQSLSLYLAKPLIQTSLPQVRVSLETPTPIAREAVQDLLRGLLESYGFELIEEAALFKILSKKSEPQPVNPGSVGAPPQGPVQLRVIRLKHARAADVAATVNLLFGGPGAFAGGQGARVGTLSEELRRAGQQPMSAQAAVPSAAPPAEGSVSGTAVIVPDEITNSLLIRATPEDFAVFQDAVQQLDIRPLQVLIEVLIIEARSDRTWSLGADVFVPPQGVGGGDATVKGSLIGGGLGDLVITVLNLGRANIDATIRAAATRGNVRILSRPVLLAANNTEARLLVGTQRPFVQVSRSLPTDTPSRDQVVQYRDVGTRLVVRPTINQDGYVSLDVQQEVNAATSEVQFDAPVISTREAATRVLVKDGQTIVLGGMRDLQRERSSSGVPLLSAIPVIGGLFGRSSSRRTETELYLFLTPRIVRTDEDVDTVTAPHLPAKIEP
jgi:general secretion pathway protein D